MENLGETLRGIISHPLAIIGLLLTVGMWILVGRKIRQLDAIIAELQELPADKRRYTLERKHKIYPGKKNLPLAFARMRRKRFLTYLLSWTVAFAGVFVLVVFQAASRAETAAWTFDDSGIHPEGFGYEWTMEFDNPSDDDVLIERINLEILAKRRHPETEGKRPKFPAAQNGRKQAAMKPNVETVSIIRPAEQFSVRSKQKRLLQVFLDGYHPPREGWIYDIRLVVRWHVPGQTTPLTKVGTVYRIGWPGLLHWTEKDSSAGPGTTPVTDPVERIGE